MTFDGTAAAKAPGVDSSPTLPAEPRETEGDAGFLRSLGKRKVVLGLVLVAMTLALYSPASRSQFLSFDDDRYVTDNAQIRDGFHSGLLTWAFTSFDQANWHPLTWLSHALDCQLFHLNPAGHHSTNLVFHAANALLLFLILQWFTGYTWRSLMVAALFAVHPLNVESVAWIAERKNVLCMFFCLLAVAAYGWYVRKPGIGRYALVAVLVAMSLMSKPMAVTLPLLLLVLDYWPLGRMRLPEGAESTRQDDGGSPVFTAPTVGFGKLFLEKIPLLALSVGGAILTMMAQRAGGAVLTSAEHSPQLRIENAVVCYAIYLKNAIWPAGLAALYPYPHAIPFWKVVLSAACLFTITLVVLKYRERRYLAAGWFWFLGTMVPMIGLLQVGNQAMADRYTYLPMIGIFILIVWAAAEWAGNLQIWNNCMAGAGVLAVLGFAAVTHTQLAYWRDDASLWAHALEVTRDNFVAENSFGVALMKQNRREEGIAHFRAAEGIEPKDPSNQLNLGLYAQEQGDLQQAAARYEWVLQLATDTQLRGSAYSNLGIIEFARHDYPRAQRSFESAIQLNRLHPTFFLDLGLIAQKNGDWNGAAENFTRLAKMEPSDVAYLLLSRALARGGHAEDAQRADAFARQISSDIQQAEQTANQVTLP